MPPQNVFVSSVGKEQFTLIWQNQDPDVDPKITEFIATCRFTRTGAIVKKESFLGLSGIITGLSPNTGYVITMIAQTSDPSTFSDDSHEVYATTGLSSISISFVR